MKKSKTIYKIAILIIIVLIIVAAIYFLKPDKKIDSESKSTENKSIESMTKEELWNKLLGYWTYDKSEFVVFEKAENLEIGFGTWYSEMGRDLAFLTKFVSIDQNNYKLTIKFPAQNETMLTEAYEEMIVDIQIDISDLANKNIIVKSENGETTYHFSGYTMEQAQEYLEKE